MAAARAHRLVHFISQLYWPLGRAEADFSLPDSHRPNRSRFPIDGLGLRPSRPLSAASSSSRRVVNATSPASNGTSCLEQARQAYVRVRKMTPLDTTQASGFRPWNCYPNALSSSASQAESGAFGSCGSRSPVLTTPVFYFLHPACRSCRFVGTAKQVPGSAPKLLLKGEYPLTRDLHRPSGRRLGW